MSANDQADKGSFSKIHKQSVELKIKTNKQSNQKKRVEELNRHISKEDIQMANRLTKRCSTSLIIREMQIKSAVRYCLTGVRRAIIKKSTNNKCWRGCGDEPLLFCLERALEGTVSVRGRVRF